MTRCQPLRRIVWALLCAPALAHAVDDAEAVFARVSPSVVTVQVLDAAGQVDGHGSGVVVAAGQVATNCHVVERAAALRVVAGSQERPAQWTRRLPGLDLCLLNVPDLKVPPVVLRFSSALAVGEPVHAVGNPLGFGLAVSSGLIAVLQPRAPYPTLVVTAPTSPGSSGGGLFDDQGRLVGLTTAIMGTGQNQSLVLVGEAVADLLAKGEPRAPAAVPPGPERNWYAEAEALHQARDWTRLEPLASDWARAQPQSPWALIFQARVHAGHERHPLAEATARQALAMDGDLDMAWLELANALHAQGREPQALEALDQAARREPIRSAMPWVRAGWLRAHGDLQQASEQLRETLRMEPGFAAGWMALGEIENDLGRSPEAARAFAAAERLSAAASADGAGSATARAAALQAQGWSAYRSERLGPAEEAFRKATELAPQSAGAWNGLAAALQHTGRTQEAEAAYTKALAITADDSGVLANRAGLYRTLKKYDLAQADALAALRATPKQVHALSTLAAVLTERGNLRDAGPIYARLAAERALSSSELSHWANALLATGDLAGAQEALRKAEADPKPDSNVFLSLAKLRTAQGDRAGALEAMERALVLYPTDSIVWSSKGYALMQAGRLSDAVQALETAVRLDPSLSNGWINLGEAQMRAKNLGRAIEALEKGMALAPRALDARYYLSLSYLQARLPEKAREHAEQLLARQPNAAPAVEVMAASYLVEKRLEDAKAWYLKLHALSPEAARKMRSQVIATGSFAALDWPN
jgi:tetratricopeptide (TPR) repeat protein